jgi:tRNA threonylcarbamoyladenosine biosynthesis protein TsaE
VLKVLLPTLEATLDFGYLLGKHLSPGSTLLLNGNLGAGKTTLVQGIGRGLGIKEPVVSPTFTLINEYLDGRIPLYHLDLYRLEPSQIDSLYPEIYWSGEEVEPGITAIEWSQRLPVQPSDYIKIELLGFDCREANLESFGQNSDLKFIQNFFSSGEKRKNM